MERIPEELVDRFFDRELDEGSRERFFRMLRSDLPRCEKVARTQRMLTLLREPVEAPDLTDRIMGRLDRRGSFLPLSLRRLVRYGRWAVAAGVLLGILTLAVVERASPGALSLTPEARPLTDVIESSKADAAGARLLMETIAPAGADASGRLVAKPLNTNAPGVFTLPRGAGAPLVVEGGSGGQQRFVAVDGAGEELEPGGAWRWTFIDGGVTSGSEVSGSERVDPRILQLFKLAGLKGLGAGGGSAASGEGNR